MQVGLPNVAHVSLLGYNLLSLKYVGEKKGIKLHMKNGKTLFDPSVGKLNYLTGFRHLLDSSYSALVTIATGKTPSVSPVDYLRFTCPTGMCTRNCSVPQPNSSGWFLRDL